MHFESSSVELVIRTCDATVLMASHLAAQSSPNPSVAVAASSRPGLLLCSTNRTVTQPNTKQPPASAQCKTNRSSRLEDSECNSSRSTTNSGRVNCEYLHPFTGQRLPPLRNQSSPSRKKDRPRYSFHQTSPNRTRYKLFGQQSSGVIDKSTTTNPTPLITNTGMPSTLAHAQNSSGHSSQYLSPSGSIQHQSAGKSSHSFKSYRSGSTSHFAHHNHTNHYPHPSVSPQPASVSSQQPEQQHQSNMWQTHLLAEPSPLLTSLPTLTLPLATPPIAASNNSATPHNGHHHSQHHQQHQTAGQTLVGPQQSFHQQQAQHNMFYPSPTAIAAALNQTQTPILNSEDTYICCAFSPRCFIIQKVNPLNCK